MWRWLLNIIAVWFLTGFWHGAEWNFIIWGLYFSMILMLEKLFILKFLGKLPKALRHVYAMLLIVIGFVIFNAGSAGEVIDNISGMFFASGVPLYNGFALYNLKSYAVILVFAVLASTPVFSKIVAKLGMLKAGSVALDICKPLSVAIVLGFVTAYLVDGSLSPFLYFRF